MTTGGERPEAVIKYLGSPGRLTHCFSSLLYASLNAWLIHHAKGTFRYGIQLPYLCKQRTTMRRAPQENGQRLLKR
ncbi:hypothetical protein EMIT0P176_420037 [Pseudomonas sp. IT-P176]